MKSQSHLLFNNQLIERYKDMIDSFGGPIGMAENFNWSASTIYRWLSGKIMGLTHAICVVVKNPKFKLEDLLGYSLDCDPIYLEVIAYFGGQSATADNLGLAQATVRAWLFDGTKISLKKAEYLELITQGRFHPSDFKHLEEQVNSDLKVEDRAFPPEFLAMNQLLRREFMIRTLLTVGTQAFIEFSKLSVDAIKQKTLGQSDITDQEIETIFQALKVAI